MFEARVREVSARRERPMGVVSRNPHLLREDQELIGTSHIWVEDDESEQKKYCPSQTVVDIHACHVKYTSACLVW